MNIFRKRIGILCLSACTAINCFGLASCQKQTDIDHPISFDSKTAKVVSTHDVSIKFRVLCSVDNNNIKVDFKSTKPDGIDLKSKEIQIKDGAGTIELTISEDISWSAAFAFDLNISFSSGKKPIDLVEYDFYVYFYTEDPIEEDNIYFPTRYSSIKDSHEFGFDLSFFKQPQSAITVTMQTDYSDILTLKQSIFDIPPESPYEIHIPILLDMSIFRDNVYTINLGLDFTNSFGKEQKVVYYGLTCFYTKTPSEEVPLDYLDLVPLPSKNSSKGDTQYLLKGLKEGVNPVEAGHYKKLIIPDNVVEIQENAFVDKQPAVKWFKNIRLVKIPKSVTTIGSNAFGGLIDLIELDISDYDGVPSWANVGTLFPPTQDDNVVAGYVWTNNCGDKKTMDELIQSWGFGEYWESFDITLVTKPEYFTLANDGTMVQGINPSYIDQFCACKIVRIPDSVVEISKEAFKELRSKPYQFTDTDGKVHLQTRRLIFNSTMTKFWSEGFTGCGFAGLLLFYCCSDLKEIPANTFEDMNTYSEVSSDDIEIETNLLEIIDCPKLERVKSFAFNLIDFQNPIFNSINITDIDTFAFQGNHFKKIKFQKYLTSIGKYAFSNSYVQPPSPSIQEIDLIDYETMPSWFEQPDWAFNGNCTDEVIVNFNSKIKDEIEKKEKITVDEWLFNFQNNHALPSNWKPSFVTEPEN